MLILILIVLVYSEYRVPQTYTQAHIDKFEEGLKEYGPNLEVVPCSKYKCVVARSDISQKSKMIKLPGKEMLTELDPCPPQFRASSKRQCHYINLIYKKFFDDSVTILNSAIRLYPITVDIPSNWTQTEIDYYNSISLWKKPFDQFKEYSRMHKKFINNNMEHKDSYPELFEIESWNWAQSIILSRAFGVSLHNIQYLGFHLDLEDTDPSYRYSTFFPFIDMLNHDYRRAGDDTNAHITYRGKPPSVNLKAVRNFQAGEEVFSFYSEFTNHNLITNYGFILKDNSHDSFEIFSLNFNNCTGTLQKDKCLFSLGKYKPNLDFYLILLEDEISLTLTHTLEKLFDLNLDLDSVSSKDQSTIMSGNALYRKVLTDLYREADSLSFREFRRTYLRQEEDYKPLITEFGETERLLYFEHLRIIDNICLKVIYHWLFN